MCKKSPEQCNAKVKCKCCIKQQEMSKLRDAYLEAKENGEVKSYKITLDSNSMLQGISKKFLIDSSKEDDTLTLTEVDSQFEQQHYIIEIEGNKL